MNSLRPYQEADVVELQTRDSFGIFNEQRTGKTPTSLTAMTMKTKGRILIVATASMVYKWQDEAHTWTDRKAYVYSGTTKQRETILDSFKETEGSMLIISYGLLKDTKSYKGLKDKLKTMDIQGLIVDEVHRAVGRNTANFKALRALVKIPYRFYLTGTPAPNHPSQVWSILTMIEPSKFSSYWRFAEEYFVIDSIRLPPTAPRPFIEQAGEFLSDKKNDYVNMVDDHAIMRKRKDVMPWLPKEEPHTRIRLPLTNQQRRYLKEMEEYYETEHVIAQGILDQLLRYRQICLAPELLGLKGKSPKIEWLKTYIKDYPDKQIIIFSRFTQFIRLVDKQIPQGMVLVGETKAEERNSLISSFQSGKLQVLTIQIDAGKEGITLDNADVLIFTDVFPPASDILQAKDRIVATSEHRNKPKEIIELCMADSYDEVLYDTVQQKIELTDIANNYIKYLEGSGINGSI